MVKQSPQAPSEAQATVKSKGAPVRALCLTAWQASDDVKSRIYQKNPLQGGLF